MSDASKRGKDFELMVAKILRSKLKAKVTRDSRSGAGHNKADISDFYNDLPLHIECKAQETVKIKEWFEQAAGTAPTFHAPTVVFQADSEVLATLRLTDLVNFLVEIADLRAEVADLRTPIPPSQAKIIGEQQEANRRIIKEAEKEPIVKGGKKPANERMNNRIYFCRAGHVSDQWGYCNQKDCKFSRGYKVKKGKK